MAKDEEIRDIVLKQFKYMSELLGVDEIKRRLENIETTTARMDKTLEVMLVRMKAFEKKCDKLERSSTLSKGINSVAIILGTIATYLSFKK